MPHGLNFTDVSAPTPTPAPVAATSVFAYFLRGKRSILQRAGGGIMLIGNCAMVGQGPCERSFHPPGWPALQVLGQADCWGSLVLFGRSQTATEPG